MLQVGQESGLWGNKAERQHDKVCSFNESNLKLGYLRISNNILITTQNYGMCDYVAWDYWGNWGFCVFAIAFLSRWHERSYGIGWFYCSLQNCNILTVDWSSVTLLVNCFGDPKRILTVLSQLQLLLFVFVHSNCQWLSLLDVVDSLHTRTPGDVRVHLPHWRGLLGQVRFHLRLYLRFS